MKEVLVVYYSQTGQLFDILQQLTSTIQSEEVNVTFHEIQPIRTYDFPWKGPEFYDTFPESYLQIPEPLKATPEEVLQKKYDLVILGYQVWFLTPSIPINSFLKTEAAKKLLQDTPVVTVIGCRNMWIMAQEKMKRLLQDCGANLVGNIALVDRNINHVSVITIQHWLFSGKKTRYLGFFPKPGVSEEDIQGAKKFGTPIKKALQLNQFDSLQEQLVSLDAVRIKPFLVTTDSRANVIFSKWAQLIIKKGGPGTPKRQKWLVLFKYYLLFAIWVIAPIVFIVFLLTYIPRLKQIKEEKKYYSSVHTKEI